MTHPLSASHRAERCRGELNPCHRGSRTILVTAWICLTGALVSCGRPGGRAPGAVVRDSAGIRIVENDHLRPLWGEREAWRLSEEPVVRIGSVGGDSTQMLYRVTDARRLPDGRVAVVNSGSAQVRLYDTDGQLLQTIGGRGDGPGEFRSPWHVYPIAGDSMLVIDLYRAISIFDRDGLYARRFLTVAPEDLQSGHGLEPVDRFGDGTLLFRGHYPVDQSSTGVRRTRIQMVRSPLDGSPASSLGDYDDQTMFFGGQREYAFGPWAKEAASESTMWYGPGDRFELREVGFDGTLQTLVRLDQPSRPVTQGDRDAFVETYLARVQGTGQEEFIRRRLEDAVYPDVFPAHFELETDALGNLWVQDYQSWMSEQRTERIWTVFDREGRYLGDVTVPAGLAVYQIGEEHLVGAWTDELGVEFVHVYRIEKSSKAL